MEEGAVACAAEVRYGCKREPQGLSHADAGEWEAMCLDRRVLARTKEATTRMDVTRTGGRCDADVYNAGMVEEARGMRRR